MRSFTAIAGWVADVPAELLARLYAASVPGCPSKTTPSKTTLWRVLTGVDAAAVDAAIGSWLVERAEHATAAAGASTAARAPDTDPSDGVDGELLAVAVDGKTVRGAVDDGHQTTCSRPRPTTSSWCSARSRSGISPARGRGRDRRGSARSRGQDLHDHPLATSVAYRSASFTMRSEPGCSIAAAVMRPRSRGTVRLATADAGSAPVLDPNYCGVDHDMTMMIAGLRLAREISQARARDPWRAQQVAPVPQTYDDAELRAYLRATLNSYKHPVGTCRIGEDDTAVVDTTLRVHGISNLRVADASVMPSIPSANTTVYAIAERAAALIDPTYRTVNQLRLAVSRPAAPRTSL